MNLIDKCNRIQRIAIPYNDIRGDRGHAASVRRDAISLSRLVEANRYITDPAGTLHDIGWSIFPYNHLALKRPDLASKKDRIKHQDEGVKLAGEILNQVSYPKKYIGCILAIISEHDTGQASFLEMGVVQDSDRLWRYTSIGFWKDVLRRELKTPKEILVQLRFVEAYLEDAKFMYTKEGMDLAIQRINKRESEIRKNHNKYLQKYKGNQIQDS
jgi:hypothetical protein